MWEISVPGTKFAFKLKLLLTIKDLIKAKKEKILKQ